MTEPDPNTEAQPTRPMPAIAALLTCHNRRDKTLACLARLFAQTGLGVQFRLDVFLVDDGCTDGTAAAVEAGFPSVNIIPGNGQLFWNGGMRLAWQTALQGSPADFFLWLNDDSLLFPDALTHLLQDYHSLASRNSHIGALGGTMMDADTGNITYGGHLITSPLNTLRTRLAKPQEQPLLVDYIDGNCVLVPATSVNVIGILDAHFKHGYGDYDYGQRLQKAGWQCWIGSGLHGTCSTNPPAIASKAQATLQERVRQVRQLERLLPPADHMVFIRRHGGIGWPVWWLKAWLRGRFPALWLLLTR